MMRDMENKTPTEPSDSEIIDRLGGTTAVAKMFEIEPPSVSEWRSNGIPKARMMYLRLAHPEVFVEVRKELRRRGDAVRAATE